MLEFLYPKGNIGDTNSPIPVKYAGKKVGTIKPVEGGWQYFPLNHKQGGEIYPTIQLVQKSLDDFDAECNACDWKGDKSSMTEEDYDGAPFYLCPDCGSDDIYYHR